MRITKSLQNVPALVHLKGQEDPIEVKAVVAREDGLFSLRTGKRGRPKAVQSSEVAEIVPV